METVTSYDVAIIGGGPGGSTTGALLKKYDPAMRVLILERETFPREHVGESLLPPICPVLDEMGCWDKIEAADFPIKIGATYRWGRSPELWDFDFLPTERFIDEPRPAKYAGQRLSTAFQVDRAKYDAILLDHASELGCEVRQSTKVTRVQSEGDRVTGLELDSGQTVKAQHYIDASGHSGILRRSLGVKAEYPTTLQNLAFWDYWQNADWAVKIGVGGTKIQIISLGYGWIWFIPVGPTRTSVGLVVPAQYYRETGKKPEDLYREALKEDRLIAGLMSNATSENLFRATKDWSFIAERMAGDNWFLVGESAGFADPILSAGLTMAHLGGKEASCTILEMRRKRHDPHWLREQFDRRQRDRILTHIRFADYWYTANEQFEDLKEFTSNLAKDVGLDLSPEQAWAWLAQGGFINEELLVGVGGFSLTFLKESSQFMGDLDSQSPLERNNIFRLDLSQASWRDRAVFGPGTISKHQAYVRNGKTLPIDGPVEIIVEVLQRETKLSNIIRAFNDLGRRKGANPQFANMLFLVPEAMEAMIHDRWITADYDPSERLVPLMKGPTTMHWQSNKPCNRSQENRVG